MRKMASSVVALKNEDGDFAKTLEVPLIVDLDGTLFVHDIFATQFLATLFTNPILFFQVFALIIAGKKSAAKARMTTAGPKMNLDTWPINRMLDDKLENSAKIGRQIFICSGSHQYYVDQVVESKEYIQSGFGSSDDVNLTGIDKRDFLVRMFGRAGFDYVGNSKADLPVYEAARISYETHAYLDNVDQSKLAAVRTWFKQLRVKHWAKNLLLFIPLIAAHDLTLGSVTAVVAFFFLFSLLASGTYLINDLLDLQSDLTHADKRARPLAAGAISPISALAVAVALIAGPILLTFFLISPIWSALLIGYLLTTIFYTLVGKRLFGVDIVLLAFLYTYRILAGTIVISAAMSVWLLALTFFLFFSMAAVKRFVELADLPNDELAAGRGYFGMDLETIAQLGSASGVASVVVFMLYVSSAEVRAQYDNPLILLFAAPVLMYWVIHLWVSARRNLIHSDPIDWAARDVASWICIALFLTVALGDWAMNWFT